jgi:hypothetical protein
MPITIANATPSANGQASSTQPSNIIPKRTAARDRQACICCGKPIPKGSVIASAILLIHNHPSGDLAPSREDLNVTKRLQEAGTVLGIKVLDHIIVGTMIRAMCRSAKSREGDHFMGIAMKHKREQLPPQIESWTYDHHSQKGRSLNRGIEYFRDESTQLIPPQQFDDPYRELFFEELQKRFEDPSPTASPRGRTNRSKKPDPNQDQLF